MTQAFNLSQLANNVNTSGQLDVTTGVTNTLPIANGGTGEITQQDALNALAGAVTNGYVLQGDGTNVSMTALSASTITTGTLPIAYGGTNGSASPTAGGIAYGDGSAYAFTSVGTSGQVLTSNGAGVPTWNTPTSFTYPSAGIANSTGTAWGTSYSVSGTGDVALTDSPTFTTKIHTPIVYGGTTNSSQLVLASTSVASGATDSIVLKVNGTSSPISALTINNAGLVSLSSALPLTSGGTGGTSAQAGINNLAGATTSGLYLRGNGTNVVMSSIQASDVPTLNQNTTGQAGSVANSLTAGTGISYSSGTTYNGSTAITISNSGVTSFTSSSGLSTNTSATGAVSVTNTAPMTYPSGTGIAVVTSGTSWGTTLTAPSGTIVGTTDTQTLTNKRVTPRVTSLTSNSATPTINT